MCHPNGIHGEMAAAHAIAGCIACRRMGRQSTVRVPAVPSERMTELQYHREVIEARIATYPAGTVRRI